ncbi:MAG: hypothetical protein JWP85_1505 [Rhodoglobus sp.]|nr:hypothetical protein [Rhodoglobus sp.]
MSQGETVAGDEGRNHGHRRHIGTDESHGCLGQSPQNSWLTSALESGPYRARTDDIHGVNVALYQLS